jgi:hypothetical protein
MTTQYTKIIATAKRLVAKFGQDGNVVRYTDTGAPAGMPWEPTGSTSVEYPVKVVIIDFRPDQVEGYAYQRGDKIAYIDALTLGVELLDTDIIVDSAGTEWGIIQPARVYPSHEDILWQCYVRQWPRRLK